MTPDELLTHLEAELARCRDERDRLTGELELARIEREAAQLESVRSERMLLALQFELDRISAGRELEVILAIAPWRPSAHTRPHAGTLIFPPRAAWGDVVAECARIATHDRMAFVELPAVRSLARIPELLDELDHADI